MLSGLAGIMFKELGWIVSIVVVTSTVIAITLTPMLSSKLLKSNKIKVDEHGNLVKVEKNNNLYARTVLRFLDKIDLWYGNILNWTLKNKLVTMLLVVAVFIASLMPMINGKIGTDFIQDTDNGRMTVNVELQRGTRIEETLKTARQLEARFQTLAPEIRMLTTTSGSNDDAGLSSMFSQTSNNKIQMTVVCVDKNERERSIKEIAETLRQEMSMYPEIIDYQAQVAGGMAGRASTVDIEIYGYDFDKTILMADKIKKLVNANVPNARDIVISRDDDRPELKVVVDKEKLSMYGLNSATFAAYVRNRVNGMASGYLKEDGDEYDIMVRLKEVNRNSISDIEDLSIPTATGQIIKLSEVARVEEHWAPDEITRKSRQRIVTVSVTPFKTSLGELAMEIENVVDNIDKEQGITLRVAGSYEDQQETFADMGLLMLLIILLVYIVMASQFESFSKPFIIMMAVPFAISGVIIALYITNTTLDMIGALGAIMLVGIVVKNGIVLVDYINLMRDRGLELNKAISVSGSSRLRPVLMTAFTTILGMLPMALSTGTGSEMWKPMGIVVIGGLFASTLITLIVVPVFYALISHHGERDKMEETRKKFIFMKISDNN
jgi:HAE1 family hydrophobic/amphiphilic exporter-1